MVKMTAPPPSLCATIPPCLPTPGPQGSILNLSGYQQTTIRQDHLHKPHTPLTTGLNALQTYAQANVECIILNLSGYQQTTIRQVHLHKPHTPLTTGLNALQTYAQANVDCTILNHSRYQQTTIRQDPLHTPHTSLTTGLNALQTYAQANVTRPPYNILTISGYQQPTNLNVERSQCTILNISGYQQTPNLPDYLYKPHTSTQRSSHPPPPSLHLTPTALQTLSMCLPPLSPHMLLSNHTNNTCSPHNPYPLDSPPLALRHAIVQMQFRQTPHPNPLDSPPLVDVLTTDNPSP